MFAAGSVQPRGSVGAGRIGQLRGLEDVRIGDTFGVPRPAPGAGQFAPPSLETVVLPRRPADRGALHVALTQLAEQDPLIDLRQDDLRQEIAVSLYGEVQKEVVAATLATDFGVEVDFRETTTICIERPAGSGAAVELIGAESNPFLATVGLRVEPGPLGQRDAVPAGGRAGLDAAGVLRRRRGGGVRDLGPGTARVAGHRCLVTMTHSGYWPRQSHAHGTFDKSMSSTAGDFRNLTPLVLLSALARAGSAVCEPMHRFRMEVPAGAVGPIMRVLAGLRAVPHAAHPAGRVGPAGGRDPRGGRARAAPAAARAHRRRGRPGDRVRPLPARARAGAQPPAHRPQSGGPRRVPAARPAAGLTEIR